jgi:hypothetical protein
MARPKSEAPGYRLHKQSGRAYVGIDGRQHLLPGPHGSEESRFAYDKLVAAWLHNGRKLDTADNGTGPTVTNTRSTRRTAATPANTGNCSAASERRWDE